MEKVTLTSRTGQQVKVTDPERCALCGEHGADAEMYDPEDEGETLYQLHGNEPVSEYVHAECGMSRGWEVA